MGDNVETVVTKCGDSTELEEVGLNGECIKVGKILVIATGNDNKKTVMLVPVVLVCGMEEDNFELISVSEKFADEVSNNELLIIWKLLPTNTVSDDVLVIT